MSIAAASSLKSLLDQDDHTLRPQPGTKIPKAAFMVNVKWLERWASDAWRWGSAIGDAHDAAAVVRAALNASEDARKRWLVSMISTSPLPEQNYVPWEECKLVLALSWQLSGHRGAHACANAYDVFTTVYER